MSSFSQYLNQTSLFSNFLAILGSRAAINPILLELRDLYSNSFKIVGLTFQGGIITWAQWRRRLLLVSLGFIPSSWLRALGSVALLLGLYIIIKLNCKRNSAHRTWRQFSYLVVINVCRFLWLVMILNGFLVSCSLKRHSSKALIIAKSSLLQILQLHSSVEYFAEKNATGLSLLLLLYWKKTPLEAQFNISVFTTVFFIQLQYTSTSAEVKALLRALNDLACSSPYSYLTSFLRSFIIGIIIVE